MGTSIYPTVKLPRLVMPVKSVEQEDYKPSLYFDYMIGDFVRDGAKRPVLTDGKEAFAQWCLKQCVTERGTLLGYSDSIGVEIRSALKEESTESIQAVIERTITEALMVNPATEYVREFTMRTEADNLYVDFVVKGKPWVDNLRLQVVY